jgi:peptide/nickel transport system substrate-binding protein
MRWLIGLAALAATALAGAAHAQPADKSTLRFVLVNDLASLDPVISTAAFVRNHGFAVYDQLFALDSKGVPQPQMVGKWSVSADGRDYSFTLRDGLVFHDGAKVRAADAVASVKRWSQRDVVGRALAAATASMEAIDDSTFTIKLARPFALVTEALARPTASALFVMPERIASTPVSTSGASATGRSIAATPLMSRAPRRRTGSPAARWPSWNGWNGAPSPTPPPPPPPCRPARST